MRHKQRAMHHARVLIFPRGECLQRVKAGPDFVEALSLVFSVHTESQNKALNWRKKNKAYKDTHI